MNRKTNSKLSVFFFTIIATTVIFGTSGLGLAQSNQSEDELPKADFTAMEKWYDVSNVEHDVFASKMSYLVKAKKEESRPVKFYMQFLDANGTVLKESYMLALNAWFSGGSTPKEPIQVLLDTPRESDLSKVKTVKVVRYKE